jgi:hypothetical protein
MSVYSQADDKAVCVWAGRARKTTELISRSNKAFSEISYEIQMSVNGKPARLCFLHCQLKRKRLYVNILTNWRYVNICAHMRTFRVKLEATLRQLPCWPCFDSAHRLVQTFKEAGLIAGDVQAYVCMYVCICSSVFWFWTPIGTYLRGSSPCVGRVMCQSVYVCMGQSVYVCMCQSVYVCMLRFVVSMHRLFHVAIPWSLACVHNTYINDIHTCIHAYIRTYK